MANGIYTDPPVLEANLAVLLDTEEEFGKKMLMVNAHPPAGGDDDGKQAEIDAIMAFIRDAREPGGELTLNENTPVVIAGDMNLVGRIGQLTTFLTGDISNNELQGEDFAPDWDGSALTSITPRLSLISVWATLGEMILILKITTGLAISIIFSILIVF